MKNYLQTSKSIALMVVASLLMTSCATIFRGKNPHQTILINGVPENATVKINGEIVGQTPLNYELKNRKSKYVQISKENFEEFNTKIETKLNPTWTAISIIGGAFPGLLIPTAIDFSTGSVKNIKTDKIEYELKPFKKDSILASEKDSIIPSNQDVYEQDEPTFNPKVRIRTGSREFLLGYKSCVTIKTKDGLKIGGNIKEIEKDFLVLSKNNTTIYYKDISVIRMYPIRRWFPIITSYTVISPIIWFVSSRRVSTTSNCKKQIKEIKLINKYSIFLYGKDRCR